MIESFVDVGYIYVLTNPAMPGLVKIGRTNDVNRRVRELSVASGVPNAFVVESIQLTAAAAEVELLIHEALDAHRHNENREFFAIAPSVAMSTVCRFVREPSTKYERTPWREEISPPDWECRRCGFEYPKTEFQFCPKCQF
jgi:predicted Zn-ribbon and HTH transcriptional regulator